MSDKYPIPFLDKPQWLGNFKPSPVALRLGDTKTYLRLLAFVQHVMKNSSKATKNAKAFNRDMNELADLAFASVALSSAIRGLKGVYHGFGLELEKGEAKLMGNDGSEFDRIESSSITATDFSVEFSCLEMLRPQIVFPFLDIKCLEEKHDVLFVRCQHMLQDGWQKIDMNARLQLYRSFVLALVNTAERELLNFGVKPGAYSTQAFIAARFTMLDSSDSESVGS